MSSLPIQNHLQYGRKRKILYAGGLRGAHAQQKSPRSVSSGGSVKGLMRVDQVYAQVRSFLWVITAALPPMAMTARPT